MAWRIKLVHKIQQCIVTKLCIKMGSCSFKSCLYIIVCVAHELVHYPIESCRSIRGGGEVSLVALRFCPP